MTLQQSHKTTNVVDCLVTKRKGLVEKLKAKQKENATKITWKGNGHNQEREDWELWSYATYDEH